MSHPVGAPESAQCHGMWTWATCEPPLYSCPCCLLGQPVTEAAPWSPLSYGCSVRGCLPPHGDCSVPVVCPCGPGCLSESLVVTQHCVTSLQPWPSGALHLAAVFLWRALPPTVCQAPGSSGVAATSPRSLGFFWRMALSNPTWDWVCALLSVSPLWASQWTELGAVCLAHVCQPMDMCAY